MICRDFTLLESRLRQRFGSQLPEVWTEIQKSRTVTGASRSRPPPPSQTPAFHLEPPCLSHNRLQPLINGKPCTYVPGSSSLSTKQQLLSPPDTSLRLLTQVHQASIVINRKVKLNAKLLNNVKWWPYRLAADTVMSRQLLCELCLKETVAVGGSLSTSGPFLAFLDVPADIKDQLSASELKE